MPGKRDVVWLVDDREQSREEFRRNHGGDFEIYVFEKPGEVLQAIERGSRPDALLCDIYFIEDPAEREKVEAEVKQQIGQLREKVAPSLGEADGIRLIDGIRRHFGGDPQFPIYAYTSKGPYLLQDNGFEDLEKLDARWLFKGKYSTFAERDRINKDIREFKERFSWRKRLWEVAVATGFASAILSVVLDRALRYLLNW